MARRVLIATAMVGNARMVIADEPTPGLHPAALEETLGHFRDLADEGRGVMLIHPRHRNRSQIRQAHRHLLCRNHLGNRNS